MAAQERSVRNSVGLTPPERPASTRCTVCFKPVCAECARQEGGGTFCSQDCLENCARTQGSVGAWHEQTARQRARRRRARLTKLAILIAAGVAAYLYLTRHPGSLDQVKDRTAKAVNEAKKGLGR